MFCRPLRDALNCAYLHFSGALGVPTKQLNLSACHPLSRWVRRFFERPPESSRLRYLRGVAGADFRCDFFLSLKVP